MHNLTAIQLEFKEAIRKSKTPEVQLNQLLLIQQQTDIMGDLQKLLMTHNQKYNHSMSTQESDNLLDNSYLLHKVSSCKNIFMPRFQTRMNKNQEEISLAMSQIRSSCSKKTYLFISQMVCRGQFLKNEKKLQREIRHNHQLLQKLEKLTAQKVDLENKLRVFENQNTINRQKVRKMSLHSNVDIDREATYLKLQKSLIYKQKISEQTKKKLATEQQLLNRQKVQNKIIKQQLQKLLQSIFQVNNKNTTKNKKQMLIKQMEAIEKIQKSLKNRENILTTGQLSIEKIKKEMFCILEKIRLDLS